jgi:hypothetical protein
MENSQANDGSSRCALDHFRIPDTWVYGVVGVSVVHFFLISFIKIGDFCLSC